MGTVGPAAVRAVTVPGGMPRIRRMPQQPLSGLRVVESGSFIPAYAGHLLAEAGADVARLVPRAGDPLAAEAPFFPGGQRSIQETWYNLGKRIVVDSPGVLDTLLLSADVLIEDWLAGPVPSLAGAARSLVRVSVSPVGAGNGSLRVNDLVLNALSGSASVTGETGAPPLTGYGNQAYHTAGMYAAICALASHRAAALTGIGAHVDLSVHEALVSCTEQVLMQWFFPWPTWPPVARRQGSLHWSNAYQVTDDRNGKGMMFTVALRFLDAILPWMEADGMAGDLSDRDRYPDAIAIARDMAHVMEVTRAWIATKDANEFFLEAQAKHLPWGPSFTIPEVVASPQIAARGYLLPRDVPGAGAVPIPGRLFTTNVDGPPPAVASTVEVSALGWAQKAPIDAPVSLEATLPLEGIRIFDFTHVLAGPFGTRVLADLGAEVVKVATALRAGGASNPSHPYYVSWNRNKKSLLLNLADERGLAVARRIASVSDAIVENFSAGVLKRWGLDRPALADVNPKVSVVSMGGMGQSGPWKSFVTFAPTIHAMVGLTHMTNMPGEHLAGYGFSLTDHLSGLAGAIAILEGVEHARRTGEGIDVDLSQYEVGLNLMAPGLIDHLVNATAPEPSGNRHPFDAWAPHGIYRAAGDDCWVAIAARGDREWRALCEAMGRQDLAHDSRFATHHQRLANQDALDAAVQDWTRGLDRYEVMRRCQGAGIAAGAVQDASDFEANDPYLGPGGFFGESAPSGGTQGTPIDRFPARFNGKRPGVYRAPHQLGADTFEFLTGAVGMDDEEVARLAADGVLS